MHGPFSSADPREIIEALRSQQGYTSVRALASAAGIPQPTLSRYLAGQSKTMEVANFVSLARVLDVTLSELLGEVPIGARGVAAELSRIMYTLPEPERAALLAAGRSMAEAVKPRC